MTTLVTGAAGFVGRQVVEALRERGQPVRAMVRQDRQAAELKEQGVEAIVGDVRRSQDVWNAMRGVTIVQHCAALVGHGRGPGHSRQEVYDVNLGGVRTVLEALRDAGTGKMILLSSINVLGTRNIERATEDLPTRREGEPHADVKIDAEELAAEFHREHGVDVTVLRPGLIYGPGERNLPKLLDAIRRGKFKFIGGRDNIVPMLHVRDMVAAMLAAAESDASAGKTYHITDGTRTTMGELADFLAEAAGVEKPRKAFPYIVPRVACSVFGALAKLGLRKKPAPINKVSLRFLGTSRFVDISRARDELGYHPTVDFREGMAETVRWIESQTHDESNVADAAAR